MRVLLGPPEKPRPHRMTPEACEQNANHITQARNTEHRLNQPNQHTHTAAAAASTQQVAGVSALDPDAGDGVGDVVSRGQHVRRRGHLGCALRRESLGFKSC